MEHVSEITAPLLELLATIARSSEPVAPAKPIAGAEDQLKARQLVRELTGSASRLICKSREQETLSDGTCLTFDIYVDGQGNEYWIEPTHGTIVQMGPQSGRYSPTYPLGPEDNFTIPQLRAAALAIARAQVDDFDVLFSCLHPVEANDRRMVYFFRYENLSAPTDGPAELPPLMQIGLYTNGLLASYINSLTMPSGKLPRDHDLATRLPDSWTKYKRAKPV